MTLASPWPQPSRWKRLPALLIALAIPAGIVATMLREWRTLPLEPSKRISSSIPVHFVPIRHYDDFPVPKRPAKQASTNPSQPREAEVQAVPSGEVTTAPTVQAETPRSEAPTPPAPLRLGLPSAPRAASAPPRDSMLAQMLNDPRSNTRRAATAEAAVADTVGNPVAEETQIAEGHRLIKKNGICTELRDLVQRQHLDPYNKNLMPLPALSRSYRCK
ncbi:hypothetical protein [Pelomonas sp. SE-A7]|uniref:hypothetical protein n=1 Tax=Pelomonas sp. SE-A7 TaxID=3054953 RepID=UPI00259D1790|nr:hypothetical protein [Pelomonas sp. SE-A7]MDM4767263.1 hypothetical protein [Pelomonas sp. SE-A7]